MLNKIQKLIIFNKNSNSAIKNMKKGKTNPMEAKVDELRRMMSSITCDKCKS